MQRSQNCDAKKILMWMDGTIGGLKIKEPQNIERY